MNKTRISEIRPEEIPALVGLAAEIWREHFPPIIGAEMVEYMLEKFQSEPAIRRQMEEEAVRYYFIEEAAERVGYMAIRPEPEALFLSKIYLRQSFRGRGLSRIAMDFLVSFCREHRLCKIWLTVNRFNLGPIAAYEKLGFRKVRTQCVDVGQGYVMDDYVMEKEVAPLQSVERPSAQK
ncbi:MAG: GNAT family N-acetyltransferase [Limisphaerales bacterium]|jgi:GNAT superfamily N-acetyltransferase|nr:GNAT family N-acetyltransferase [Verrucomicrobiota bacterium]